MRVVLIAAAIALTAGCASTHPIEPRVASSSVDFSGAETAEVKLGNFSFTPSDVTLKAGRPYVLKIVNTASGGHDFTAPEFFAAATVAPQDAARIASGQVELGAGETAMIRLVPAAGEFKLVCTHFGHAAMGMTGKIIVH
ncbi:MAG TPA: cupredoxin domain-containing protein [Novosphingobium sp.]|nr:cupredoxin domain-containing protein [Novosphingobium sp.]